MLGFAAPHYWIQGCFFALLLSSSLSASARDITLGVLAWRDAEAIETTLEPTLIALRNQLPDHVFEVEFLPLAELEQAVAEGRVDFVMTNPGHYVQLNDRYSVSPIATLQAPDLDPPLQVVGSVVVTLAQADSIQDWTDLKDRRIGAVSADAFGGFQLVRDKLERAGLNVQRDIGQWVFTGFPMENLIQILDEGQVDAIILRSCLLESLAREGKLVQSDYRPVIDLQLPNHPCWVSTPLYPDWPFLQLGTTDPHLARQVLQVLLQVQVETPQGVAYKWAAPLSYRPVYDVFERLRLGPFAAFPLNPFAAFVHQYRFWLLGLMLFMLLGFMHHLRAEYLVRRRTRELDQSLKEQRQAEAAAHQRQSELLHLSRFALMGELAAGLAHELNQPLTAIVNYANGCYRYLNTPQAADFEHRDKLLQASELIAAQGEQAGSIIKNLRAFLRKETPNTEVIALHPLLVEALEFMQASFRQHQVELDYSPCPPDWLIQGDRVQLLQILVNLLANAVDAMQAQPQRRLSLRVTEIQDRVAIHVIDTGVGIPKAIESHLFDPFFTTKPEGMGLGLRLSQTLAEAHHGQLMLHDHPAGGAEALLILPGFKGPTENANDR